MFSGDCVVVNLEIAFNSNGSQLILYPLTLEFDRSSTQYSCKFGVVNTIEVEKFIENEIVFGICVCICCIGLPLHLCEGITRIFESSECGLS